MNGIGRKDRERGKVEKRGRKGRKERGKGEDEEEREGKKK